MTSQKIKILKLQSEPDWIFKVVIEESNTSTSHQVSMTKEFYKKLKTNSTSQKIVKHSFQFLLENEPKESILSEFDISIISTYFPDYLKKLKKSLNN